MASGGLGDGEGTSDCRAGEVAARVKSKERCGQPCAQPPLRQGQ